MKKHCIECVCIILQLKKIFGKLFKVFHKFADTANALIPDFGVSTAILNTIDISLKWCKLSFVHLRGQVKAHHFPERTNVRRQYFSFPYKFLGIIGRKRLEQPFWIMVWIYYFLLNGIRLDLDLVNSY